jgi:hypothetical protein
VEITRVPKLDVVVRAVLLMFGLFIVRTVM